MMSLAEPPASRQRRFMRSWQIGTRLWPVAIPAAVAMVMVAIQLAQPDALTGVHGYDGRGNDDGVYFSASLRLLRGVLPYADFDHVHPPGLVIVLLPFALLDLVVSQDWAFAAARVLTVFVAGANAFLAARLVRHRGVAAALAAGLAMALYPNSVSATHTIRLEPYLVLFCLVAALLFFEGDRVATLDRVLWAGLALACAASVKVWALVIVLPTIAVALHAGKAVVGRLVLGLVCGVGIVVLPLAIVDPGGFVSQVVFAQLGRSTNGIAAYSVGDRLSMLWGFEIYPDGSRARTALLVLVAVVAVFVSVIAVHRAVLGRSFQVFDAWVYGSAVLLLVAMHAPAQFYHYYTYFVAPFLAIALGLLAAAMSDLAGHWLSGPKAAWAIPLSVVALAVVATPSVINGSIEYMRLSDDPGDLIAAAIPVGACVVTDMPTLLVVGDRTSPTSGCPAVNDPFGLWLTRNDGLPPTSPPPYDPTFRAQWMRWFQQAEYVVLSIPWSNYIPWDDRMRSAFDAEYRLIAQAERAFVYQRIG
jgi:alpha-1,2-mannosyltransferase